MNINTVSQTPISLAHMKLELEKIKTRDTELGFRSTKTDEFLQSLSLDAKKSDELIKKIETLEIPRLKLEHIIKIADLMPATIEELKVIFQAYTITVSQENMKKIQVLVDEYVKK